MVLLITPSRRTQDPYSLNVNPLCTDSIALLQSRPTISGRGIFRFRSVPRQYKCQSAGVCIGHRPGSERCRDREFRRVGTESLYSAVSGRTLKPCLRNRRSKYVSTILSMRLSFPQKTFQTHSWIEKTVIITRQASINVFAGFQEKCHAAVL